MILIDPELDPDPRPRSRAATPGAVWGRSALPWAERLPTPRTLSLFLSEAQEAVRLRGQVTVLLTTDREMRRLNRQFRGQDKPTDILSFPAKQLPNTKPAEQIVGDLAIGIETARRQAVGQGHALTCELKVLILHGLLHLAGYDHESDAGDMERRERLLRSRLKLPLGLIERASRRESTKIAQGEVRNSGRNPGTAPRARRRRPVGPARNSASSIRSALP